MALFDVPGWHVPANIQPISQQTSRKRKRPVKTDDLDSTSKLQTAEHNLEKLMKTLDSDRGSKNQGGNAIRHLKTAPTNEKYDESTHKRLVPSQKQTDGKLSIAAQEKSEQPKGKRQRKKLNHEIRKENTSQSDSTKETSMQLKTGKRIKDAHLTGLQSKMKERLTGSKFRFINETLYTTSSSDAVQLMHENPQIFEEYHAGFRHQVTSWPSNPVDHFIKVLSSYKKHAVIVDLGCGEAALARNLVPKGFRVLSYDLVSANPFIIASDICDRLPLPGSETNDEGHIVDIVICSLSLMSKNWLKCIREARRILKRGGELKIAEVTSRFVDADKFTSVICAVGFQLVLKDESNSHFTLFDFRKTAESPVFDDKTWSEIMDQGEVLQPCEYKRR